MMEKEYCLLLDLLPLLSDVSYNDPFLAASIQDVAFRLLVYDKPLNIQLEVLIRISTDLGYMSEEVSKFLMRQIKSI